MKINKNLLQSNAHINEKSSFTRKCANIKKFEGCTLNFLYSACFF